jgi:nucleoside-diphosphate-sugar epimerase
MRVAITGGSGLIGRAVIESGLQQRHTFVNIDRVLPPPGSVAVGVPFVQAEVTDYSALEQALRGSEGLIHLAAIPKPFSHPDHEVHNTNVVGSYNALRAAVEVGMTRICQASSVNAIGHAYSRRARYDYFPIDELHPTYNEDPYSLSKWVCEQQADSIVRRYENVSVISLRFHWVTADRSIPGQAYADPQMAAVNLTAYTRLDAAVRACLLALTAPIRGHEVFFVIAPDTAVDSPSLDLAQANYPDVPVRGDLSGNRSFFDSSKAERLLGWSHGP